jgi:parallel beta-helix repeat protein
VLQADLAAANPSVYAPYITIQNDGTIEPETSPISRSGNTYTLTANLTKTAVKILCSNITFDGAGHNIIGGDERPKGFTSGAGLQLEKVSNVTVKNVKIIGFSEGIVLEACVNCFISRVDAQPFDLRSSNDNIITENEIFSSSALPLLLRNSSGNLIYNNNITIACIVDVIRANSWDNGSVGNYWSHYSGIDSDGDGIGDTPYIIGYPDKYPNNIDYYPLIEPVAIQIEPLSTPVPIQETPPAEEQQPEPFPTALVIAASGAAVAIAGVGVLVYFRKRKMKSGIKHE